MYTKFIWMISLMQGQVSLSFSCEKLRKVYILQVVSAGFPQCKREVSVAETVHTPIFQIDSTCWNYLESPSFSKFLSTETVLHTLRFRIAETCWKLEFQGWNYAKTIRIPKLSIVSAMLKKYVSFSEWYWHSIVSPKDMETLQTIIQNDFDSKLSMYDKNKIRK